ncbi:MAG: ketopantoate reductase family protein [Frankia sp.]
MRYVVVGAGAVGGTIGGRLAEHGFAVTLVARGAHGRVLTERGLTLGTPDGPRTLNLPVVDGPAALTPEPGDVFVLATKTQDSLSALDTLSALPVGGSAAPGTPAGDVIPLVCAQNGVENERLALRRFAHVYGMWVMLPGEHLEPGRVSAWGTPYSGLLDLGRIPAGIDDTARRIASDLTASRLLSRPRAQIMPWKYAKLLRNLGNAVEALCGPDAPADELLARVVAEGTEALRAAGIEVATDDAWAAACADHVRTGTIDGRTRDGGSSWQSLTRGLGSIETDYLNGEIVLLGRQHGVPTPVNQVLVREANAAARAGLRPGSRTPDDMLKLADLTLA